MKCDAFWGLDGPPHKYIVEFSKEEVEFYINQRSNDVDLENMLGHSVLKNLTTEYKRHNEVDK